MNLFEKLVWLEIGLAGVTFLALMFIAAPYGRHSRGGWGPTVPNRVGWIVMELAAVVTFLFVFLQGDNRNEIVPILFLIIWQIHYLHRTFIFPFRIKSKKAMPLLIPVMAIAFNLLNGYINGHWVGQVGQYTVSWLTDWRFITGVTIFAAGMAINIHSDTILIKLRKPGETGYKIPEGGMYRYVSCPNYFGELLEWIGWAIATWSLAGLAFALYTAANLVPRALENHRWYKQQFPDYPGRKAVIPGLL